MAIQDQIFWSGEGDAWFRRNREKFLEVENDWPIKLLLSMPLGEREYEVLELGSSNGWRLHKLAALIKGKFYGIDASQVAIEDGRSRYPELRLEQAVLSEVPLKREFDIVIVNYVLHWVDRKTLARSLSEIDRLVRNQGYLVVGDFLPDYPQRRPYHHRPEEEIFTYKQDYVRIFESYGTYKEISRVTYNHDDPTAALAVADYNSRGVCSLLKKDIQEYYAKVP